MSLAEFVDGYLSTLRWSASAAAQSTLRREITKAELSTDMLLAEELAAFYAAHPEIEQAKGIEGLNRSVAWQCGHDLCFAQNGRHAFDAAHWGQALSAALLASAQNLGKREIVADRGVASIKRVANVIAGLE